MAEADASALLSQLESSRTELAEIRKQVPAANFWLLIEYLLIYFCIYFQVTSDQDNKRQVKSEKEAELASADEKLKLVSI